jgi:hypothetical protein
LTTTPVAASTVDTAAGAAPTPSTAARTSREEIRLRRLALAAKKQEVQQKASTPPHITIPSSPTGHIAAQVQNHLTKQVTDLQHKYSEKENQAAALQLELEAAQVAAAAQQNEIAALQLRLTEAAAHQAAAAATKQQPIVETPTKGILAKSMEDATEQNLSLQSERDQLAEQLRDALFQVTSIQQQPSPPTIVSKP